MRSSSPSLAAAFAEGVTAQGLDVTRIGLASTDQLYFASGLLDCPGAMFTASHNPAAYNGIKLCRAGRQARRQGTGLDHHQRGGDRRRARIRRAAGHDQRPRRARRLRRVPALARRPVRAAPAAGRRRRGQRHGRPHHARGARSDLGDHRCCRCTSNSTARSRTTRPTRWTRRTSSTCRRTWSRPAPTSGWRSTATPTAASSSTNSAGPCRRRRSTALVAARELSREIGATVIHNLITSRAVPELIVERGGTPVRSRVGHSYIKALMAETGAIFGGEHSAHYYFRDFWGADSGMLAALHVLAALGEQDRPLSRSWPTTSATRRPARSTSPSPTRRPASTRC